MFILVEYFPNKTVDVDQGFDNVLRLKYFYIFKLVCYCLILFFDADEKVFRFSVKPFPEITVDQL